VTYDRYGDRLDRIVVVNLSDPSSPMIEATTAGETDHKRLAISGDLVASIDYIGGGDDRPVLRRIENGELVSVATLPFATPNDTCAFDGAFLHCAQDSAPEGLYQVYDISTPEAPALVSETALDRYVAGDELIVVDGVAIMANGILTTVDVSDRSNPTYRGMFHGAWGLSSVASLGGSLVVSESDQALMTLDTSAFVDFIDIWSRPVQFSGPFALQGEHLFGPATTTFRVVDISNPGQPEFVSNGQSTSSIPERVVPSGDWLYYDNSIYINSYDISDIENPAYGGRSIGGDTNSRIFGFDVNDTWVVASRYASAKTRIDVYDRSTPATPQILGSVSIDGFAGSSGLVLADSTAYIHVGYSYRIVSLDDPTAPMDLGDFAVPYDPKALARDGDRLLVAGRYDTALFDISDPRAPVELGSFTVAPIAPGLPRAVALHGDTAALSTLEGTYLLDITQPDQPVLLGAASREGSVILFDDWMLISGLYVFDISACETCVADLAAPFGELTFGDINAFLQAFAGGDGAADLAEPFGELTFGDINAFLQAFAGGCP
jgi:hypothetical protein